MVFFWSNFSTFLPESGIGRKIYLSLQKNLTGNETLSSTSMLSFFLPCIGTSRPLGCSVHSSDTRPFAAAGILDIHFFNLQYDKFCNKNFPISKQKHPTIK